MLDIQEIIDYLDTVSPNSKVYIGCDSEVTKLKKRKGVNIRYAIVVVVHIAGSNGAKIFGTFDNDHDDRYDTYKIKPQYRLMNEVYKVSDLYLKLAEALPNKQIEVHLDLNPNKEHLSNKVVNQALGYVKGVCGVDARLKPDAWAASAAADKWCTVLHRQDL
jgi:uncharacterized protein